jgi:hypothetical protein
MDLGIAILEPFLTLNIDVLERLEGSVCSEVVPEILDSVLYLAFCLSTIGITEPHNDTIVLGEAHELSVEPGL